MKCADICASGMETPGVGGMANRILIILCIIGAVTGKVFVGPVPSARTPGLMKYTARQDNTIQEGWLRCNGQTLDAVTNPKYADLFALIGTTYGGSGISSFSVPNGNDRIVVGAGSSYGLNGAGGARSHTITTGQMPNHSHGGFCHTHRMRLSGADDNNHTGNFNGVANSDKGCGGSWVSNPLDLDPNEANPYYYTQFTTSAAGGNGSHENMPPFISMNMIISY
jgi:microcystin-dependent protein